jgi:hypothetical protein
LFGEETGEFIDFTGWAAHTARITKFRILDVKTSRIG